MPLLDRDMGAAVTGLIGGLPANVAGSGNVQRPPTIAAARRGPLYDGIVFCHHKDLARLVTGPPFDEMKTLRASVSGGFSFSPLPRRRAASIVFVCEA